MTNGIHSQANPWIILSPSQIKSIHKKTLRKWYLISKGVFIGMQRLGLQHHHHALHLFTKKHLENNIPTTNFIHSQANT